MNLFGKKKEAIVKPSQAIAQLQETISTMEKRELFLDKQISSLRQKARDLVKKDKSKAIFCLKRAKLLEKQLESSMGAKFNLEMQIASLIQALNNTETVSALSTGYKALSALENKIDPDKVSEVMDEITEAMSSVDEVSETISRPIGPVMDDDELLRELESMGLEELEPPSLVQPNLARPSLVQPNLARSNLPSVPQTSLSERRQEEIEDEELKELERVMNA